MSAYVWSEKESKRTRASRRKIEREEQAKEAESLVESLGVGIEPPPFASIGGDTERRLDINEGCAGILIGKKGENIRNVEQRFKVTIRIEDVDGAGGAGASARRAGPRGGAQQVVVSGASAEAVADAARELDIVAETIEVSPEMAGWVVGRGGKHLKLVRELTGISVLSVHSSGGQEGGDEDGAGASEEVQDAVRQVLGEQDSEGDALAAAAEPERCWFQLKGQRERVADARMCLEAHIGYYPVYLEMNEAEADLDQEISEAQAQLGRTGGGASRRPRTSAPQGGSADDGGGGTGAVAAAAAPRNGDLASGSRRGSGGRGSGKGGGGGGRGGASSAASGTGMGSGANGKGGRGRGGGSSSGGGGPRGGSSKALR